jgi:2'-5' RNA ligase
MALLTLAYPQFTPEDADCIAQFRQIHDQALVQIVAAHWTMVFPVEAISADDLQAHVGDVATKWKAIPFTCRYAMLHADRLSDNYYLFLVPDEGFSSICRLHDDLYKGIMRPHLRLDLPYVPHIGIGTSKDPVRLKDAGDEWNHQRRVISGRITRLTVSTYDGKKVRDQMGFELKGANESWELTGRAARPVAPL